MKYRRLGSTGLSVSEVGFGVWSVSTGWWGKVEKPDAIRLLQRARELGVTLFDTADTYAEGYGEELLREALGKHRHEAVIGTKFGYDWYNNRPREGHRERPQRWDPQYNSSVRLSRVLRRVGTDYVACTNSTTPVWSPSGTMKCSRLLDQWGSGSARSATMAPRWWGRHRVEKPDGDPSASASAGSCKSYTASSSSSPPDYFFRGPPTEQDVGLLATCPWASIRALTGQSIEHQSSSLTRLVPTGHSRAAGVGLSGFPQRWDPHVHPVRLRTAERLRRLGTPSSSDL